MIRSRWIGSFLAMLILVSGASAGALAVVFGKKPKTEAQVKRLLETVRTDADEKKRLAAIVELQDADPRTHPDVIPTLIAVLQKDANAPVRAEAAETIGQFRIVYPVAGLALEAAAELDASRPVREKAQQALWEYHLAGYRSLRGADGIAGQTAEPPISRPATSRPVSPASAVSQAIPEQMPAVPRPPVDLPTIASQPPASTVRPASKSPTVALKTILNPLGMLRSALPAVRQTSSVAPAQLTLTPEPPLAQPRVLALAPMPTQVRHVTPHVDLVLPPVSEPPDILQK